MIIPSFYKIKQTSYAYINKIANKNWVAKIIVSFLIWSVALIPFWIYLFFRWLIAPFGFWQELATIVVWGLVLGWLQVIGLVLAIPMTLMLIFENW
jgi:hypothetical protein